MKILKQKSLTFLNELFFVRLLYNSIQNKIKSIFFNNFYDSLMNLLECSHYHTRSSISNTSEEIPFD